MLQRSSRIRAACVAPLTFALIAGCAVSSTGPGAFDPDWALDLRADVDIAVDEEPVHRSVVVVRSDRGQIYDIRDLIRGVSSHPGIELGLGFGDGFEAGDFEVECEEVPIYDPDLIVELVQSEVGPDREVRLLGNGSLFVGPPPSR